MSKLVNWTISLSVGQKLFALFETISNLGADHLTLEGGGGVACEQQTYFRSSTLSHRKITFRRERSDDRKYVCCSQARGEREEGGGGGGRGGLFFFQQEFFFAFSLLCRIFFPQERSVQVFVKMCLHSQTDVFTFTLWLLQL